LSDGGKVLVQQNTQRLCAAKGTQWSMPFPILEPPVGKHLPPSKPTTRRFGLVRGINEIQGTSPENMLGVPGKLKLLEVWTIANY